MTIKKILLPVLAVVAIGGATYIYTGTAHAATSTTYPWSDLVTKISQKFGLDKTQVQTVFDDFHAQKKSEREADMKNREEARLTRLVTDKKITEAQKQAILSELTAIKSKYNQDALKDKTPEERKTHMQAMKDELTTWAKNQGIDPNYLFPTFGGGPMMRMHRTMNNWPTPTP
jgi:Skp family chaperone for outer membrane proteins